MILGFAGGDEAAEILEVGFGEREGGGSGDGMGDAVEAVGVDEKLGRSVGKMRDDVSQRVWPARAGLMAT
jgi:hypothetical protein